MTKASLFTRYNYSYERPTVSCYVTENVDELTDIDLVSAVLREDFAEEGRNSLLLGHLLKNKLDIF